MADVFGYRVSYRFICDTSLFHNMIVKGLGRHILCVRPHIKCSASLINSIYTVCTLSHKHTHKWVKCNANRELNWNWIFFKHSSEQRKRLSWRNNVIRFGSLNAQQHNHRCNFFILYLVCTLLFIRMVHWIVAVSQH